MRPSAARRLYYSEIFQLLATNAGVACSKLGLADLLWFIWNQYGATSYVIFFSKMLWPVYLYI